MAGIQYAGEAGASSACKQAVIRLIQGGDWIQKVQILSCKVDSGVEHAFLITINNGDLVAVKSGFSSGYLGAGPRAFTYCLSLFLEHDVDVEEYDVDSRFLDRLEQSALTVADLEWLDTARPVWPERWYEYIVELEREPLSTARLWADFPPIIPYSILDPRLADLAKKFWDGPDQCLFCGYRRLEDVIRARINSAEHGVNLFKQAFLEKDAELGWQDCQEAECKGRAQLFTGAYMAYRNPRAHREQSCEGECQLMEFLLLNHLFILEKRAVERVATTALPD